MNLGFDTRSFDAVCDTISVSQRRRDGPTFPGDSPSPPSDEGGLLEGASALAIGGGGILVLLIIVLFLL